MTNSAIDLYKKRRTQYAIGRNLPIEQAAITDLIQNAVKQAPTAFNSQSSRAVILLNDHHDKLWELVLETLRAIVPADAFASTEQKIGKFAAGAGTVLFFEDQNVVKELQEKFPLYADNFPAWSEHATGIAQFAVWTALAEADIGASLQHYNPIIDDAVSANWNLPASWKLRAQMPFGSHEAPIGEKTFMNDEERFRVFS